MENLQTIKKCKTSFLIESLATISNELSYRIATPKPEAKKEELPVYQRLLSKGCLLTKILFDALSSLVNENGMLKGNAEEMSRMLKCRVTSFHSHARRWQKMGLVTFIKSHPPGRLKIYQLNITEDGKEILNYIVSNKERFSWMI